MLNQNFKNNERRIRPDRRNRPLLSCVCSLYKGRRQTAQRMHDQINPAYVDVYDSTLFCVSMMIISLCVADAYLTLIILSKGGTELNPFMNSLLAISPRAFFFGKYVITSIGLFLAVMHVNFLFLRLLSIRTALTIISGLYIVLIVYEVNLITA